MSVAISVVGKKQPNQAVVDLARDILQMAESGELLNIAYCGVLVDRQCIDAQAGAYDMVCLLGTSLLMQDRIKAEMDKP